MNPEIGFYKGKGFTFRVDLVRNGEVYVVRWKGAEEIGTAFRVSMQIWERDAKFLEWQAKA